MSYCQLNNKYIFHSEPVVMNALIPDSDLYSASLYSRDVCVVLYLSASLETAQLMPVAPSSQF